MQITTTSDLMRAAANALIRRDGDALQRLISINSGWLQTAEEGEAQQHLLMAMAEAAYLLEDEASEVQPSGVEADDAEAA